MSTATPNRKRPKFRGSDAEKVAYARRLQSEGWTNGRIAARLGITERHLYRLYSRIDAIDRLAS